VILEGLYILHQDIGKNIAKAVISFAPFPAKCVEISIVDILWIPVMILRMLWTI